MNVEYQVSISLRWLGTSGLNTITTPLESFIKAGQHDSNLCTYNYELIYSGDIGVVWQVSFRKRVYIWSTYLKSPAQSHSSTSHAEFLLPLDKLCDSNSSILKTDKCHIWINKNKTFGQAVSMYTCCNIKRIIINPPYSLCRAVVRSDCLCCVRQKIGQCCFPTLSIWNVEISDIHK